MTEYYGRIFERMFTGSMAGCPPTVFAVWAYCLAYARPPDGEVELHPGFLRRIINTTKEDIEAAIEYLCKPDPESRSKECEGRRLVHLGEFRYRLVNWGKYYQQAQTESRKAYKAEWQKEHRQKTGVDKCGQMKTHEDISKIHDPDPKPLRKQHKNVAEEQLATTENLPGCEDTAILDVVRKWNTVANTNGLGVKRFNLSADTKRHIHARLSEDGWLEDFRAVLERIPKDDWLLGKVPPGPGYDKPYKLTFKKLIMSPESVADILERPMAGDTEPASTFDADAVIEAQWQAIKARECQATT